MVLTQTILSLITKYRTVCVQLCSAVWPRCVQLCAQTVRYFALCSQLCQSKPLAALCSQLCQSKPLAALCSAANVYMRCHAATYTLESCSFGGFTSVLLNWKAA